jgi:diguanylate cyclase (GGDEF)-like protein
MLNKLILLIFIFPSHLFAQFNEDFFKVLQDKIDYSASEAIPIIKKELLDETHNTKTHLRLRVMLASANMHIGNYEISRKISVETLRQSIENKDKYFEARATFSLANIDYSTGNYYKALDNFKESQHIFAFINDKKMNAFSFMALGAVNNSLGDYKEALVNFQSALKILISIKDSNGISQTYNHIGTTYHSLKNLDKALQFYKNSLSVAKRINDWNSSIHAYSNISEVYSELGDLENAILNIQKANTLSTTYGTARAKLYTLISFGELEAKRGNMDIAKTYFSKVLQISKNINAQNVEVDALINLAKLKPFNDKSLQYALLALSKAQTMGKKNFIRDAYEILSRYFLKEDDYRQAYMYFKEFHNTNADLIKQDNADSLAKLTNSLDLAKSNYEIELLKTNEKLNKSYIEEQKYSKALWVMVVVIVSLVLFTSYRRYLLKQQTKQLKLQVQDRTKHMERIGEIGKEITSTIEVNKVVALAYQHVKELFGANVFGLGIFEKENGLINFPYTIENGELLQEYKILINEHDRLASICVNKKKELILNHKNMTSNPVAGKAMKSVVYLPLSIEENIIGCITIQKESAQDFTEYDINIIRSISSYISVALVNSLTLFEVKSVAYTDYLTQLPNRRSFIESFDSLVSLQERTSEKLCIAITDIDNFKLFNDKYGHDGGDYVLKEISKLFKDSLREQDVVARWGGEEFVFILPNTDINGAKHILNNIRQTIEETTYSFEENTFSVTSTFGVVEHESKLSLDESIAIADQALYKGKQKGRNIVICS